MPTQNDGKLKIIIYGDDSAATEAEHEAMSELDIEARGGVDCHRFYTAGQAAEVGADLSWLDEAAARLPSASQPR
jgi:hypothetical protein